MTERQILIEEIARDEGTGPMVRGRHLPYTDTVGKTTIGYGRNLTDNGLSSREAFTLLEHDVDEAIADLSATYSWFARLDGVRQRALVNMRFNLGPHRFRQFRQTLAATEAGDYRTASTQMLKSKWAGQVGQRAVRLARMMATGSVL